MSLTFRQRKTAMRKRKRRQLGAEAKAPAASQPTIWAHFTSTKVHESKPELEDCVKETHSAADETAVAPEIEVAPEISANAPAEAANKALVPKGKR